MNKDMTTVRATFKTMRFACVIVTAVILITAQSSGMSVTSWPMLYLHTGLIALQVVEPEPADGRRFVTPDVNLSWTPAGSADGYNVYFGTDFNEANQAQPICLEGDINCDGKVDWTDLYSLTDQWPGDVNFYDFAVTAKDWQKENIFKGNQDSNTYDPGLLQPAQQYYWRIDQVNDTNINKGDVWSFRVIDLSANQFFPQGSPLADVVDLVNVSGTSSDTKLAAITLQGQINSGPQSKVFLYLATWDPFWLARLLETGRIEQINSLSIQSYFQKYANSYQKVVVYDPDLLATVNIATMIASLENGIVIHPDDIADYGTGKTVHDLRGLWTSNVDAYQWAFDNLWTQMNQYMLACYHPTALSHHIRDYLIRNKVFTFWVTSYTMDDPPKSDYNAEKIFLEQLLAASPENIPVIGFWYNGASAPGIGETEGVRLSTKYGKLTTASAWPTNLSLISGTQVDWQLVLAQYNSRPVRPCPQLDLTKVYICFDIVDSGDAPGYWMYQQYNVWQDSNRGNVPINWSLGPGAIELMPAIMEWFYTQAEPNDNFYMGLSGAGYAFPYNDFMANATNPDAAWGDYLSLTQHYVDSLGLSQIGLYTNIGWFCFNRVTQTPITRRFANGLKNVETLLLGLGRDDCVYPDFNYMMGDNNDVLVSHITTRWNTSDISRSHANNVWLADDIRNNTPTGRPAFMHVMALSWSYYPSDLLDVLNELGDEYVAVSAADFKSLYMQAN